MAPHRNGQYRLPAFGRSQSLKVNVVSCSRCSAKMSLASSYEKHWDEKHPELDRSEMYKDGIPCSHCPRYFQSKEGLDFHINCNFRKITREVLAQNNPSHSCAQESAESKTSASKPQRLRSFGKIYYGPKQNQAALEGGKRRKRVGCTRCRSIIMAAEEYDIHWAENHSGVDRSKMYYYPDLPCPHCRKKFKFLDSLNMHQAICKSKLTPEGNLKRPCRNRGSKPIGCTKCTYTMYMVNEYEEHWNEHHSEVQRSEMYRRGGVPCEKCSRYFYNKKSLQIHQRQHKHRKSIHDSVLQQNDEVRNVDVVDSEERGLVCVEFFKPTTVKTEIGNHEDRKNKQHTTRVKHDSEIKRTSCSISSEDSSTPKLPTISAVYSLKERN